VFYDLRSHGRSSRSAPEHCRLNQLAIDLEQVLDEVAGPGPVVLIGHSMGGMTIMRLAASRPELFGTRVVGVGCCTPRPASWPTTHRSVASRAAFSRVAEPLMASLNRIRSWSATRRGGQRHGLVATDGLAFAPDVPPSYVEYVSEMLASTPLDVVADFYPAFRRARRVRGPGRAEQAAGAVSAGETTCSPRSPHRPDHRAAADAVALRLPHCGHLGMIDTRTCQRGGSRTC
jgi:pimeloyl-ACP methyl ester carboxylesterase